VRAVFVLSKQQDEIRVKIKTKNHLEFQGEFSINEVSPSIKTSRGGRSIEGEIFLFLKGISERV
jgi:hypothetical protein